MTKLTLGNARNEDFTDIKVKISSDLRYRQLFELEMKEFVFLVVGKKEHQAMLALMISEQNIYTIICSVFLRK